MKRACSAEQALFLVWQLAAKVASLSLSVRAEPRAGTEEGLRRKLGNVSERLEIAISQA